MDTPYFTVPQLARLLRVNGYTIRRWIKVGLLEAETIAEGKRKRYRVKKAVIDALPWAYRSNPDGETRRTLYRAMRLNGE